MDEKVTMTESQWEGHVSNDVLPSRLKFIEKAAEEGRLIKVEQKSGNKIVKCPECNCSYVEAEEKLEPSGAKKLVIGGRFSITFFINTGEEIEVELKPGKETEEK